MSRAGGWRRFAWFAAIYVAATGVFALAVYALRAAMRLGP